jgi:prephenate dehydratase
MGYGAICTPEAATSMGLDVIASGVQDLKRNAVRFLVISKETNLVGTSDDKTMLTFVVQHTSGALSAALNIFATHNVSTAM